MKEAQHIASALVVWYAANKRALPWRRKPYSKDPYCVYVSEIMLQQTQVKTVIPYWDRWMRELPTVEALAAVDEARLLKLWEGLGYYSRARNLQKGARVVLEKYGGRVPRSVEELESLPGVGPYTAGAIASIAFDEAAAAVDGNVIRVLARLFLIADSPASNVGRARFWERAGELMQEATLLRGKYRRPCGDLTEGLMELGATVCTPVNPECGRCPVAARCEARLSGRVSEFPKLPARAKTTERHFLAGVFECGGKFLARQRESGQVNGGLWEFPNVELKSKSALKQELAGFAEGTEVEWTKPIQHSITRYRITVWPVVGRVGRERRKSLAALHGARWVRVAELEALALTAAHRRLWRMAAGVLGLENR